MNELHFALLFAALVVGYVLLHVRVARFEVHLEKLASLRSIDDRLRQIDDRMQLLGTSVDRIRTDRVESQLERLHSDLLDLREVTANVQNAVVQIPAPVAPTPSGKFPTESSAARMLTAVENRLFELGYHEIRVLNDLGGVEPAGDVELQVECWRGGMPLKGRVLVRNCAVRDVALQTVVQMFP